MIRSFVLGNGISRLNITPDILRPHGKIYGCNALYREFTPDYLIAVDPKMIIEIQDTGYQESHEVWTNRQNEIKYNDGFKYFEPRLGWSSGPSALQLATTHQPTEIYIFGFDFTGVNNFFNNVYAGTDNYKRKEDMPTYWGNWEKQTEQIIRMNPHINYYRVVENNNYYNTGWLYKNFKIMKYQEFDDHITRWAQN